MPIISYFPDGASSSGNQFAITIPAGRMRGDVDGDGLVTIADYDRLYLHLNKTDVITDETQLLAADIDGDGTIKTKDQSQIYKVATGEALVGKYGEITGNWTANPNYATEASQFYTDIPVDGMTAMSSAVVTIQGYHEQDDFRAECIEGAIRIYAKLCPISEVKAIVQFGDGDGSAIVLCEGIDGVATVQEMTYAEYQALAVKDPDTMYVVTDVDLLDLPIDDAPTSGSTNAVSSGGVYAALEGKSDTSHTHDDSYYTETEVDTKLTEINNAVAEKAPAYTYGTDDLTAGSSPLETGKLYFVYE